MIFPSITCYREGDHNENNLLLDQIQAGLEGRKRTWGSAIRGQKTAIGSVKMFEKVIKGKEYGGSCHDLLW